MQHLTAAFFTEAEAAPATAGSRRPLRVLAAEDGLVNRKLIVAQLAKLNIDVQVVENGALAVDAWENGAFDAILMDCHMPVMDGWQASREIRAREGRLGRRRIPIIALTATALQEDQHLCQESGMDAWMSKPASMEAMRMVLQRATGVSPAAPTNQSPAGA
jgi:CheY-like chemotaxis protein